MQNPDDLLDQFESAWKSDAPPELAQFLESLPASNPQRRQLLLDLVQLDLEYRWRSARNQTDLRSLPLLEMYLQQLPELGSIADLPEELIGEEYLLRHWLGDRPSHADYLKRFPSHAAQLPTTLARLDAELADDFTSRGTVAKLYPATPTDVITSTSFHTVMSAPVLTTAALLDLLRREGLVSPVQLDDLVLDNRQGDFPDAQSLIANLVRRLWLTPFQANFLLQGQGLDLLIGPYVLTEKLGEGGTGQVYKARHKTMQRDVALKIIRKELLAEPDVVSRFYREIRIVGQLDHPNIVRAYDAGPIGTAHCLAMEYFEGIDLARRVREAGPLPMAVACNYIVQAARGLQHAHEHGLVHRDIKPPNLIVGADAQPVATLKILDLGLARLQHRQRIKTTTASADEDMISLITPQGSIMMGTPDYMAPEQALDFHEADIRADIYSLGCTFFYLLTGQPPFPGGTLAQKLLRHQSAPPPDLGTFRADVPEPIAEILKRMLAKRPADRYQTPHDLAYALTCWSNRTNEGPVGLPPGVSVVPQAAALPIQLPVAQLSPRAETPTIKSPRRRGLPLVSAALSAGMLLAGFVAWIALSDRPDSRPTSRPRPSEARAKNTVPSKPPGLLFIDHFESGNLNQWKRPASHTWRIEPDTDGKGNVLTGGTFSPPEIDSTEAREDSALYCGDLAWTDYAIDTWVRFGAERSPSKRFYGIILFARIRPGANYWFEYGVQGKGDGEGKPTVYLFKRAVGREFQLMHRQDVPKPQMGRWQHVRFEVEGKMLRGYIDDQLCIQAEDDSLKSGRAGLTLSNVSTACARIEWKDFRIQALPTGAGKPAKSSPTEK